MKSTRYFLDYSGSRTSEPLTEVDQDQFEQDCNIPGRRITIEGGMVYEWVRATQEAPQQFDPTQDTLEPSKRVLGPIPLDCGPL